MRSKLKYLFFLLKLFFTNYNIKNLIGLIGLGSVKSHTIIGKYEKDTFQLVELEKEEKANIFTERGKDQGYHNYSNAWWYNLSCPHSYKYLEINSLYPKKYYISENTGHPDKQFAKELYDYMQLIYNNVFKRNFNSILELGTGAGEITYQFLEHKLDFTAVEGSDEGVEKLKKLGVETQQIIQSNLKKMQIIDRKFDMVMCTEVIEHIEPFFASKIVELCTYHSDVVWFSAANRIRLPHYHHCNEISIEAWDNIFAYFGYNLYVPLNKTAGRADRMYINCNLKSVLI